jgi:cellulose synthase/poly-beta-1,6-N-acetylglucosamine synthase-like glycosyltransferase
MKLLFWISLGLIAYANFGYAIFLWMLARIRPRPVVRASIFPSVSIIIAARNEERNLPAKLQNIRELRYPNDRLEVVIASDGSSDRTAEMLLAQSEILVPVILDEPQGKANALNEAVRRAKGEILLFLDLRQAVDPDAVTHLVSCLADPEVGAVSGELVLETNDREPQPLALGLYWKLEKAVRKLESETGSVVGATGAIYAIRREYYSEIPKGTILDDVFVPMHVARMGKRVVFEPSAIARDRVFIQKGKEFKRKVRTLTGNYQLLRLAPWMLTPANPLFFRLLSHKVLRLVVPVLMIVMVVTSAALSGWFWKVTLWLQLGFYGLAALGGAFPALKSFKPAALANTYVVLNLAAVVAFYNFVRRREKVWV